MPGEDKVTPLVSIKTPQSIHTAISRIVDALCGEAPSPLMVGPGASRVRDSRAAATDALYALVKSAQKTSAAQVLNQLRAKGMIPNARAH